MQPPRRHGPVRALRDRGLRRGPAAAQPPARAAASGSRASWALPGAPDANPQKLTLDWSRCDGHGLCAHVVPDFIRLDGNGYPAFPPTPRADLAAGGRAEGGQGLPGAGAAARQGRVGKPPGPVRVPSGPETEKRMRISRTWAAAGPLRRAATAGALAAALSGVAACTGTAPGGPVAAAPASTGAAPTPTGTAPTPTGSATGGPSAVPVPDAAALHREHPRRRRVRRGATSPASRWCSGSGRPGAPPARARPGRWPRSHRQYRDTVPIVGVAGLGEQKAMKEFVTEFDLARHAAARRPPRARSGGGSR